MKRLALLLMAFVMSVIPVFAAGGASGNASIASGAQSIALGGQFSHVVIWLSTGSSTVNVNFLERTATTSDALIDSGAGFAYGVASPVSAISQVNYYGNGTTGKISWIAF